MSHKKYNVDLISTIIMFLIFVVFFIQTGKISDDIDAMFPYFILYSILVLVILLALKSFKNPEVKEIFNEAKIKNVCIGVGSSIIWIGIINFLGFSVSGFIILMFITQKIDNSKNKFTFQYFIKNGIINSLIVIIIYVLFAKFLEVPLPKGLLI